MSQQKPDPARPRRRRVLVRNGAIPGDAPKRQKNLQARPALDDLEAWKTYWEEYRHRQPWQTEPKITTTRQQELTKCSAIIPDIEKGIYPFSSMKLSRADVEWLLLTYGDSFTPEKGLDVRGADLNGVDLSRLALIGLRGGLATEEWWTRASQEWRKTAAVQMNKILLKGARLQGAILIEAQLKNADIQRAHLQGADLRGAQLQGANLAGAQLEGADLSHAQLEGANLINAKLQNAHLNGAKLEGAHLINAQLQGADLSEAQLQGADLSEAQLQGAMLDFAQLQDAKLIDAQLQGAKLGMAQLQGAWLLGAQLQGADLSEAQLQGAMLGWAIFADLQGTGPRLGDVGWDGTNLAVVDWSQIKILGDEYSAHQKKDQHSNVKDKALRLGDYRIAVRANRQLAVALQAQGLNEDAARFAYRANVLQRKVLWFQMVQPKISLRQRGRKLGAWGFSHLLNLLAGHGYKPERSFLAYLLIVLGFMGLYLLTSHFATPHLSWDEALVLSLSSFHGRGFFTQTLTLGDPYARLAVAEAVLGLFVEVSLIATFTQRFFGK